MQAKQHVLQPAAGMVGRFAPTLGLMAIPGVGMPAAFANEYLASAGEDITKYGATPERALAYAAPQAALNTMTRLPFGSGAMLAERLGLAGTEAATRGVTEAAAAARQRAEEAALELSARKPNALWLNRHSQENRRVLRLRRLQPMRSLQHVRVWVRWVSTARMCCLMLL
jgi:hypothetical protein